MFENDVLLSGRISKKELKRQVPQLRVDLVNAQFDLDKADFSVIVVIAGDDRVGANRLYDRLCEWMDARFIETNIYTDGTDEEEQRPRFWRYWRVLPPAGRIGIFGGAWSLAALADRLNKSLTKKTFRERLEKINNFESDLADDGSLIVKFWVHLPPAELKKQLKNSSKDPDRSWWSEERDWEIFDKFRSAPKLVNYMLEKTNSAKTPWYVIDGTDDNFRDLKVASILRDALQSRLEHPPKPIKTKRIKRKYKDALGAVDLSQSLTKKQYKTQLTKYQRRLHELMRRAHEQGVSTVLAFEGWDAGGKGGTIRRLTSALPARSYKLVPIAAPTSEEKARHYLWRFWRHMPLAGRAVIFDRTWYGRVTVERIEGFASQEEWRRAYDEINDFERQIRQRGTLVLKFWMHISPKEQLARFKAREVTPYKKYKITEEDYRNRSKWDEYVLAINEMVAKTCTKHAPWHLVPANDKPYARIYVLKTVCDGLEGILKEK